MNHYTTFWIREATPEDEPGVWFFTGSPEINAIIENPPDAVYGASSMLLVYPEGFRKHLAWVKEQYGDYDILITENGFSTSGYNLTDYTRIKFIRDYLEQLLLSFHEDKLNVVGYSVWALIDNLEWLSGYTPKLGLYEVDFNDPAMPRRARLSSKYYKCIIRHLSLDVQDSCSENDTLV